MTGYTATLQEIAALYGWSLAYTRKLASRDKWGRKGHGPRTYSLADVGTTVAKQKRHTTANVDSHPETGVHIGA